MNEDKKELFRNMESEELTNLMRAKAERLRQLQNQIEMVEEELEYIKSELEIREENDEL